MPTKKEFTLEHNSDDIVREFHAALSSAPLGNSKDILIVVKDQPEYTEQCLQSIFDITSLPFHIYIWDNGSQEETVALLEKWKSRFPDHITFVRREANEGFIVPNNRLAAMGSNDYIILLNSDTRVRANWDTTMIGWLQANLETAEVGYLGGWLDKDGKGCRFGFGYDVDYLPGWAICISRETYNEYGLFDEENLDLAYAEDADLSLRLREAGKKIYALHSDLVTHFENKTVQELRKDPAFVDRQTKAFESNHEWIKKRWGTYLPD